MASPIMKAMVCKTLIEKHGELMKELTIKEESMQELLDGTKDIILNKIIGKISTPLNAINKAIDAINDKIDDFIDGLFNTSGNNSDYDDDLDELFRTCLALVGEDPNAYLSNSEDQIKRQGIDDIKNLTLGIGEFEAGLDLFDADDILRILGIPNLIAKMDQYIECIHSTCNFLDDVSDMIDAQNGFMDMNLIGDDGLFDKSTLLNTMGASEAIPAVNAAVAITNNSMDKISDAIIGLF